MSRTFTWLCSLLALAALGCDRVVEANELAVLGNRGAVLGVNNPNAVLVKPGGMLLVADADLTGRGRLVEEGDAVLRPGEAISVTGGAVRIAAGSVAGGNLLFVPQNPQTEPRPPSFLDRSNNQLAPGISATDSVVEIDGGTVSSSAAFGLRTGPFGVSGVILTAAPALAALRSDVRIDGGTLRSGVVLGSQAFDANLALTAVESRVAIGGGSLEGALNLAASRTVVRGGALGILSLGRISQLPQPQPVGAGCTEIRGGTVELVAFSGDDETLFVFGTDFNLPLGRVTLPPIPIFPTVEPSPGPFRIQGTLEDGSPIDLQILGHPMDEVFLAAPGQPGCPS